MSELGVAPEEKEVLISAPAQRFVDDTEPVVRHANVNCRLLAELTAQALSPLTDTVPLEGPGEMPTTMLFVLAPDRMAVPVGSVHVYPVALVIGAIE